MENFHLTEVSRNSKTGPIPVATISRSTCPTSCPLMGNGGCYAEFGPLRLHWNNVDKGKSGTSFDEFLKKIKKLPRHQLWRYGQAGDLPGEGDNIDEARLTELAQANAGRPVIAFTHKPPTPENLEAISKAADLGFHINLSADDMSEADQLANHNLSVVVVLANTYERSSKGGEWTESLSDYRRRLKHLTRTTPQGRKIAVCPATYTDTRCSECGVCSTARSGKVIIGFPAHGVKKHMISRKLEAIDK